MASIAAMSNMSGGVAKKIALFEFVPPDTNSTSTGTRLRRKDAIKRKKYKNSHQTSPPSSMSSTTMSDLEIQPEGIKSARTIWLSSSQSSSSESYGRSSSFEKTFTTTGNSSHKMESNQIQHGIMKIKSSTMTPTTPKYFPSPNSMTGTSSSDDYETNEFSRITKKMNENIAIVDALVMKNYKRNSFDFDRKKFEKHLNNRITRSMRDCYQSFSLPIVVRPGNLKLVEFTDSIFNSHSHSDGDITEDEPFYEELDDYSKVDEKNGRNEMETDSDVRKGGMFPSISTKDEVSISLISKNDEETTPSQLHPPTPPPYESLYSELIYGQTNGRKSSINSSSSYVTPNSSLYNRSIASSTTTTTPSSHALDNIYSNNPVNKNQTGFSGSQGSSLPFYYNGSTSTTSLPLPPIPINGSTTASSTTSSSTNGNGGSGSNTSYSIAKLAGNKLTKKFKFLRKLSKSSLDNTEIVQSSTPCLVSMTTADSDNQPRRYSSVNTNTNDGLGIKKLSISRPNIPPPEPPRNPPILNGIVTMNGIRKESPANRDLIIPSATRDEDHNNDDDSDFYDSDSELIRNFVAAVQPIYSMEEEPLYQYYSYGISMKPEDNYQPVIPKNLGLTLDMLIPRTGQRTLWCEIPEVQTSGILGILSDQQKKLQEAIFEVLTSEVSYLKSLNVLVSLFFDNNILVQVLTAEDRAILFGNISEVKDCSQSFLAELLNKWEESWYIQDVGQIINHNANNKFHVYKEYCRNKPYQDKILQKLRNTNDEFVNIIKSIEEDPKCQMLKMDSFLMLPMQRITRLPLLVNAILQRTQSLKEKSNCEDALKSLTNLVLDCNESARESQDAEETAAIFDKIEFPKNISSITYPGQFLLKGDFVRNPIEQQGIKSGRMNWSFQKKKRTLYWLILFTNQLFITRKRSSGKYEVVDMLSSTESGIKPLPNLDAPAKDFQHLFMLQCNKVGSIYVLAARTQSEVDRWKQKLDQLKSHKNLKVEAIFLYDAKREDELSFMVGDIIQVSQIQPDGWYFGMKIDTEETGWFPGNYCAEC